MTYTLIILAITFALSAITFNNENLYQKLIMWPKRMDSPTEYYRLLTSGFIHADWPHLIFNMITLYFFGQNVEYIFSAFSSPMMYVVMYLLGIIVSSLPSFIKHRNDGYYRSLGASGGVASVLFASIYFMPWSIIRFWFIPIPGIIAGVGYLIYSAYMSRRGGDNINHNAHFWGAIFGFVFAAVIEPTHGLYFFQQLMQPSFNF
jgi:Uncharacterized membrane protein (homolog of Drosophila rhomboid)